jgi:hypothetical protein
MTTVLVRRAGVASVATLSGLALTILGAQLLAPDQVAQLRNEVLSIQTAGEESRALDRRSEDMAKEFEVSDYVCELLVAGKLTLDEAVDEMEPRLHNRPGFDRTVQSILGAESFRHAVARYLIQRVKRNLGEDADPNTQPIIHRLEEAYAHIRA